jgi:hypothetical protein
VAQGKGPEFKPQYCQKKKKVSRQVCKSAYPFSNIKLEYAYDAKGSQAVWYTPIIKTLTPHAGES